MGHGRESKRGVERLKMYETDRLWLTAWLKGLSLPQKIFVCYSYGMAEEATVRRYSSLDEMKADEYRYWQSRPGHELLDAVEELIETAYALKGWKAQPDEPRLQRPFVRLPCPWR